MTSTAWRNTPARLQRGFSLFELVVVILLISVLMSLTIDRIMRVQVDAERVSVQHVIGTLDSAINLQVAEMVVNQGVDSMRSLEQSNPMSFLSKLPYNYLGIKSDVLNRKYNPANWYYDATQDLLVYKIKNTRFFQSDVNGAPRIRLRLALIYKDGVPPEEPGSIRGIRLLPLEPYEWKLP